MLWYLNTIVLFLGYAFTFGWAAEATTEDAALAPFFYQGHDLSSLKLLEEAGTTYKDTARNNRTRPAEDILGDALMNSVRLRLWVSPKDFQNQPSSYDLAYTLNLAKRFHAKGYKIYLDYHFSDTWADPQKQYIPKGWPKEVKPLASKLRSYVATSLKAFHTAGVPLSIVSLGNEIRNGMLWPTGKVNPNNPKDFANLATLLKAAREGVSDAVTSGLQKPAVMIHIDNGWDANLQNKWFSALTASGTMTVRDWDTIGLSFYPFYGNKATFANLERSMNNLAAKYSKPIMVVETDYPAECAGKYKPKPNFSEPDIPIGVTGQIEWNKRLVSTVKKVAKGLGQGVFYWEPAWTNNTGLGSGCEDVLLFKPDWSKWPNTIAYSRKSVEMFR